MPRDVPPPPVPETPRFWAELEKRLTDMVRDMRPSEAGPPTAEFDRRLARQPAAQAPRFANDRSAEPRFPAPAAAAIVAIVLATALTVPWLPGRQSSTVAAPGVARSRVEVSPTNNAEEMVVASFQRFVDDRHPVDRLTDDLRNQGYEVSVTHLTVADPTLDGTILGIRHASDDSLHTLAAARARGPVIVIVAKSVGDEHPFN